MGGDVGGEAETIVGQVFTTKGGQEQISENAGFRPGPRVGRSPSA